MDSRKEALRGHLSYRTESSKENWRDAPRVRVKALAMDFQKERLKGYRMETSRENWRDDPRVRVKALRMDCRKETLRGHLCYQTESSKEYVKVLAMDLQDSQKERLKGHQMALGKDTRSVWTTEP